MRALSVLTAYLRRDAKIDLSYKTSFALDVASILAYLMLFFYLGRVVDDSEFATDQGLAGGYFGFVAVGLALLEIVTAGLGSFSAKLRDEQTTGTFEAVMAAPASASLIVLASASYDLLRAVGAGLVTLFAAIAIFGLGLETDPGSLLLAFFALVASVTLFGALGVAVAAFTVVFKKATSLLGIITFGLALLGGVYFPIDVLPPAIEAVARALPFTWALDLLRATLLGGDVDPLQLVGLFVSAAVLLPLALIVFGRAVRRAREHGSLAEY